MPRPEIIDWVEENTGITECAFYASMTYGAYGAAVKSLLTGQFWLTGGLALVGRAAELTAQSQGCFNQPLPPPTPSDNCWKVDGSGTFQYTTPNGWFASIYDVEEILSQNVVEIGGILKSQGQIRYTAGNVQNYSVSHNGAPTQEVRLTGAPCTGEEPAPPTPEHNPGDPIADPVTHTDSQGCNWTIQATDAYVDASGVWHTYYTITADNDACGGPFAYWSSGGEGPPDFVTDPGNDPDGNPYSPPPPKDYQPDFEDIEDKIDKIKEELDAVKDCACGDPKPELLGDWVSIRFVSDGISPNG